MAPGLSFFFIQALIQISNKNYAVVKSQDIPICKLLAKCQEIISLVDFLGGLRVTNPPIRLMCPTSVCLSVRPHFSFPDSNFKTV